jgi:hypothetical protein
MYSQIYFREEYLSELACALTMIMEVTVSPETSVGFQGIHAIISQKAEFLNLVLLLFLKNF